MSKAAQKEQTPILDKKDLEILKFLQQNARMTVREIAEKVHLSTTPGDLRIR
jgi:Lrp/AsnC family leucine-responsive transcriptional regulator